MLKVYKVLDNKIIPVENGDGNIFIYINPDEKEKKFLVDEFRVDEHTLNSSLDPDELSRLEYEPEHVALIFKSPKNYSTKEQSLLFKVNSIGAFLFKDKLVIVTSEEIPFFPVKQFAKVGALNNVLLKLIYSSTFHFLEHLKVINLISDEIERKISTAMENKYLLNQFTLGKSLVFYQNAINSNSVLLEKLKLNSAKLNFTI